MGAPKTPILPVIIGFLLLSTMVVASLVFARAQSRAGEASLRLFDYQAALLETLSSIKDAEIGQRGYLLTRNENYLGPYRSGIARLEPALARLPVLGDADGERVAAVLRDFVVPKMSEMDQTIALARQGKSDVALAIVKTNGGQALMQNIRKVIADELTKARATSEAARRETAAAATALIAGLVAGLIAIIVTAIFWARATRDALRDIAGARDLATANAAALRDEMSGREAAEAQVRQMQKMESIGALTGGIAHDFNNMLAIVIGGLDLAKRRLTSDPAKALVSIGHAREGAERAATLTARLLAFSRQSPLAPEPVDANKLVTQMSELLQRTIGETVQIETVLSGGLWRTHADAGQLENAIVNLAVNARDAMADQGGGKLTIETANTHLDDDYARTRADVQPGQYVAICVTDTGIGMDQATIDRAFDPFFTTKPVGKGTGLGLSQVFGFTKQSGGHLAIYSEVGHGTTVKLYLPRFMGASTGKPEGAATFADDDVPAGRAEEIILVVEDEQRVRHFSVDALREIGYTALSAATPSEALKIISETPAVQLLFTDVVMPEMDGRKLADAVLAMRPDIKVLFTTGYTRNAVVHHGRLDPGVVFLPKPYSIAQLARKVRALLDA